MDTMREMILGLEHTAANPIMVDEEETVVEVGSSSGEELEVEENEVAVPIPMPGRLVLSRRFRSCLMSWWELRLPLSWPRKIVLQPTIR